MKQLLKHLKYLKKPVIAAMIFAVLSQVSNLLLPVLMSSIINNGIANSDIDYAIRKIKAVNEFLMQRTDEKFTFEEELQLLEALFSD